MALSDEIIDILGDWGKQFEDDLRANLLSKENNNTKSRLSASIKYKATVLKGDTFIIQIGINDYYKFVDEGRKAGNVSKQGQDKIGEWGAKRAYIKGFTEKMAKLNLEYRQKKQAQRKAKNKKRTKWKTLKIYKNTIFAKQKKQFAYVVSRKIKMKGYKGNHFYSEIVNDGRVEALEKILSETIKREVKLEILKNVNG